jgi:hypothetical protein
MARNTDGLNRNTPFFIQSYGYVDISAADFDPITDETDWRGALNDSQVGSYRKNGFLARPDADGAFYAITWDQYHTAMAHPAGLTEAQVIAAIVPQRFEGADNQWIECLLVKVFASNDGDYATVATSINVGLIL